MIEAQNLSFELGQYETATSYVSRLTRYCGLSSPTDLCLDLGFRWQDLIRGDDFLYERLAGFGGVAAADMQKWAVRTTGHHQFTVSKQRAIKGSLTRTRVRVCPDCIIENRRLRGPYGPYRKHMWHLLAVRTCDIHDRPLMMLPPAKFTISNYDFIGQVERHWDAINQNLIVNVVRQSTDLERYVADRLEARPINPFLDNMPLFIATRLCEVLGYVLLFGPSKKFLPVRMMI